MKIIKRKKIKPDQRCSFHVGCFYYFKFQVIRCRNKAVYCLSGEYSDFPAFCCQDCFDGLNKTLLPSEKTRLEQPDLVEK